MCNALRDLLGMRKFLLEASAILLLAGCLGPVRYHPAPLPPATPPVVVPPPPPVTPVLPPPGAGVPAVVLWAVRSGQPPLPVAEFLAARPQLHLGLILPENFFGEDEPSRKAKTLLGDLAARHQVEFLLTLPDRPVLALITDGDLVKLSTVTTVAVPQSFQWPDDVIGQAALAKSVYHRRWRASPSVLEVPWGAVVGPELQPLAKLGIRWFYLGAKARPGFYDAGGPTVAVGAPFPTRGGDAVRRAWLAGNLVSGGNPPRFRAPMQVETMEELSALDVLMSSGGVRWVTPSEAGDDVLRPSERWTPSDLSSWIGKSDENRAWQLLGITRKAVEDFKNSGKASVQTLDRAVRGIFAAENGETFFHLGADATNARSAEWKREFLASLEQVFRFLGEPPPAAVRQGFSGGGEGAAEEGSEAFFRRDGATLVWRDGSKDDRGPGDFFYPTGSNIPVGAWDLRYFRVEPRPAEVVFRWEMAALANPAGAPGGFSLELIDTYIDINHLPGAGSEILLPGRPGQVEPQNAWEFALSVDGWGARLYQPWQGGGPRRVATLPVKVVAPGVIEVSVPRKYLRGEPEDWGFAVAVMGRSPSSPGGSEPAPMPVAEQPGPDRFGGALKGYPAPPYIDLLTEGPVQNETLSAYKQGRDVVLPFVRAE